MPSPNPTRPATGRHFLVAFQMTVDEFGEGSAVNDRKETHTGLKQLDFLIGHRITLFLPSIEEDLVRDPICLFL